MVNVEVFESPFKKGTYSRNVWDMQVFNGKIYIGQGNSSNSGPDTNAGPIPVTSFNPANDTFTTEFTVDEEQIDRFKVLNNKLVVPGHDSRESWDLGNFYVLEDAGWKKYRTVPNGVHVLDMEYFNGKLFAAIGNAEKKVPNILVSNDFGKTWAPAVEISQYCYYRVMHLINFKNTLYSSTFVYPNVAYVMEDMKLYKWNGTYFIKDVSTTKFMPGVTPGKTYNLVRPTMFKDQLLYIAGLSDNDMQYLSKGLYSTPDFVTIKKLGFAEPIIPMDILVRSTKVYVLGYIRRSPSLCTVVVYESLDANTWTETLRFDQDTFARSFEELNGDFYFGLGCDTTLCPTSTGRILRVRGKQYSDLLSAEVTKLCAKYKLPFFFVTDRSGTYWNNGDTRIAKLITDNPDLFK